ncbi:PEP-CTERM sorting domain-containing protein [Mucisphaera sp.]|uniref:PEP-CTERM sorting domain-containing protein n=1 Tax=Mucisphaera sp. TaxID=2913024 RepID=UPI003D0A80EA
MTRTNLTTTLALAAFTAGSVTGSALAADTTLLFDFGRTNLQTSPGWNNVVPATTVLFATFDSNNNLTPVGFEITDTFFQIGEPSSLGTTTPGGAAASYPGTATDDYFFGHVAAFAGAEPNPLGQFKLFNLDAGNTYDFTFFASRTGVGDIRDAKYTVKGAASASVVLDAANNTDQVAVISGISPDGNGEIFIDVEPGPNNSNTVGFYYLGTLEVGINAIPEPASIGLLGLGALALLRRR